MPLTIFFTSINHNLLLLSYITYLLISLNSMVPDLQKPRVTEIHVRMDCNGCVQKVKKALNGINGIYDLYIDFPQQKITIFGWADPEKIIKAIKKTRKMATICNIEPIDDHSPSQPEEPSSQPKEQPDQPEGNAQVHEATKPPPPTEAPPAQAGSSEEPPKDTPPSEQPQPEATLPSPVPSTPVTKDVGEVHVTHHHPPNYGNRFGSGHTYIRHWNGSYHNGLIFQHELPQPVYVTQSYNTYRPSPYVTEYEYLRSPPRQHIHNNRVEQYSGDYYHNSNGNNITSIFSDENPNACRIV